MGSTTCAGRHGDLVPVSAHWIRFRGLVVTQVRSELLPSLKGDPV